MGDGDVRQKQMLRGARWTVATVGGGAGGNNGEEGRSDEEGGRQTAGQRDYL